MGYNVRSYNVGVSDYLPSVLHLRKWLSLHEVKVLDILPDRGGYTVIYLKE